MRNTRSIIITDVYINRIVVHIEGENTNPNLKIKEILIRDYISNNKLIPTQIVWQGNKFFISFNLMSLNNESPIHSGDWYLVAIDQNNKYHESYPTTELIKMLKEKTFNMTNRYNVYFDKDTNNYYHAESKIDEDNLSYYLKVIYKIPPKPLKLKKRIKKAFKGKLRIIRQWGYVKIFNFFKLFNNPNGNRILFTSSSRSEIGGNEKFVYERMVERGLDKNFKISFSYKDSIKSYRSLFSKFSFTRKLAMANIVIVDDYQPEIYLVKFLDYVKVIQLWHACGAFKTVGLERIGKPGAPKFDTDVHKCYTYMTVSSELSAQHYAEAFGINEEKIVPVGIARTDIFFDESYKRKIVPKVLECFPQCKTANEVIMYAPTFRGANAKHASFPMDMIDYDLIGEYLLKTNSIMLIKMHPFVKSPLEIPEKYKDVIIDASVFREINDILFVTDILITDYSSVIYEFSLFNKPMLFYAFDRMKYEADRGFYEPYSEMVPGKIVRTSEQLVRALEKRDFEFEKVAPFVKKNFKYTDGKSTDRIIDQLIINN
ncbi:CDP-glycerol glycerophosphotransferase family protein [Longibaculum muris]|uniref:CDP-glycerol glycerophosphotransferase family protein n=1 Tax=Longibaculum muris TaxID=1796628 RepID=UPI002943F83B|nr:CDP-glycerol glycerophosphotransferase family protein [Longibaculum muris]